MAGPFRGDVGKLKKKKSSKKGKSNTSHALVRRSRKLPVEAVKSRIDALINPTADDVSAKGGAASSTASSGSFLSKVKVPKGRTAIAQAPPQEESNTKAKKVRKTKRLEVVGSDGKKEVIQGGVEGEGIVRTTQEAQDLKLLHKAVKDQSHGRVLPHQQRHDFEFRLRKIATLGVVRLFNSLAQAQSAGDKALEESQRKLTIDKAQEKKLVASRDAFLAALRQPGSSRAASDVY